jgi:metalloprotease
MLKLLPILLMLAYGYLMFRFSAAQTARHLKANSTPLLDPTLTEHARQMAQALELPQIRVNVYDIEAVNGLASPDGQIYLTRGFIERRDRGEVTDGELASVIAHELGHVALGHSRRRMIDFSGQNAVVMMLSAVLNRFLPGIGVLIARGISGVLMASLSRRDEFEADAYASALLIKSGIGVAPQISLFEKLPRLTGANGTEVPAWTRSHPQTQDRIAAIKAREARWQG